jgi:hypothetical protein
MPTGSLVLPPGTRLLHVGPHKTGTTSLQAALFASRAAMLEQGVRHVGRTRNPAAAVRAVTGQPAPTTPGRPPSIGFWRDLVGEFRHAREPLTVVSSEFFAWARPPVIDRIAGDLGRDRLHVVVTLRPLGRILPSQWQQNVQAGMLLGYADWLDTVFGERTVRTRTAFWWLHRHDELIGRWAAGLGRDRITAVVVDERDHGMLLRTFESLLGLREGTIGADRDLSNRSMTVPEVEAVRAFNAAARTLGIPRAVHARSMRFGAAIHMKQRVPDAAEPRIETPQWALDRALEMDVRIAEAVRASGTRVVGDLTSLTQPILSGGELDASSVQVPPRIAADMAVGILLASGLARDAAGRGAGGPAWIEPIEIARGSTWQLVGVLGRRYRDAIGRRARRLLGRRAAEPTAE